MAWEFDHDDALIGAFLRLARDAPDAPLVWSPYRSETVRGLHDQAGALAARLATHVPERGGLVGVSAPNGSAFLVALVATRLAGHAALLLDADAPLAVRAANAQALGAAATLTATSGWSSGPDDFVIGAGAPGAPRSCPGIAVVKLTSGSTGAPRGVAVSTAAALADESALAETMGLTPGDRLLGTVPFSHSYGFTTLALSAVVRGLPIVLPEGPLMLASLDAAATGGATVFPTTPAYLSALLSLRAPPALPATVRLVLSAGARLTPEVASSFRRRHGRPVHTFYGSSECGGICYDPRGDAAERGTVGPPVRDVQIEVVPIDDRRLDDGLIVVRSPAVAETYLPVADPRLEHGRFETSDLGRLVGGELALVGRTSQTINVRGRKVEPVEVERTIRRLDGVADVVVLGVVDRDGQERVRAVVASASPVLSSHRVREWCLQHLSQHKVPRSIVLVGAIRYTNRGKVDAAWLAGLSDADHA